MKFLETASMSVLSILTFIFTTRILEQIFPEIEKPACEESVISQSPTLPTFSDDTLQGLQELSQDSSEDRTAFMIIDMAREYGVSEEVALAIAQCESGLDPYAMNPVSSAKGIYQFTDGTWEYIKAQGHQFDAEENIKNFMIWYPLHPDWWQCE